MKNRYTATGMFLIVALAAGTLPSPVRASDRSTTSETPILLYSSAQFGPIGAIKLNSLGGPVVAIDGRIAKGEESIWGGELIQVGGDCRVNVVLDAIGQVTLARGATVRFARARASSGDAVYEVLVASVVAGTAEVKLNPCAGAFIRAGTSEVAASRGASFRVNVEEGRALLNTIAGVVRVQEQPPPQDVNIRVVDDLGRPVSSGSQFSVRARSTRQVQVQVTDKNDKPLPDLPVLFSLGDPCLGSLGIGAVAGLTLVQKTDKRGIAAVPLVAGAARCAASIVAKVEGTNASVTIQTNVQAATQFWSLQNTTLVTVTAAAAAAAGIGIGLAVANSGGAGKLMPVPPPTVKP
jgi:hypothetical protein